LLNSKDALDYFKSIKSYEEFITLIKELNGIFAIIIKKDTEIWLAVDRARSIPIFMSLNGEYISDSAEEIRVKLGISTESVDDAEYTGMLLSRNTSSGSTMYKQIIQMELGQTAIIKNGILKRHFYFKHTHPYDNNMKREELLNRFGEVTDHIFDRLIKSAEGKKIILPLSGGYDSRYIAAMLKKKKYHNVVCYTYGNEEDYEVQFSKKVAYELGFEWHYIRYTKQMWKNFFKSNKVMEYFNYVSNHSSLPHIQEYMALNILKEKKVIDDESIIVTGFCGDLPAGSFIEDFSQNLFTIDSLIEFIYENHFTNTTVSKYYSSLVKDKIRVYLNSMEEEIVDQESFISQYEAWFTASRPSMWVVNSNRVYEFFGLEWRLPLWDNEFLDFWYSVPNEFRDSCNLYTEWLFKELFEPLNIDMRKPNESSMKKYNYSLKMKVRLIVKKLLIYIGMKIGKDLYKRNNINNYNQAAICLYKLLKTKKAFTYTSLNVHQLEQLWWCEFKYGENNLQKSIDIK